jgi:hypothetical protein
MFLPQPRNLFRSTVKSAFFAFVIYKFVNHVCSSFQIYVRHWLTCRSEQVECKGKGMMTTYWCEPQPGSTRWSSCENSESSLGIQTEPTNEMLVRLVEWNILVFVDLLNEHRGVQDNEHAPTEKDVNKGPIRLDHRNFKCSQNELFPQL